MLTMADNTVIVFVMTDGRKECIAQSIPSLVENLSGDIHSWIIHDDSGDSSYQSWLRKEFPSFELIYTDGRSGFSGAYANIWRHLSTATCRFVFGTEDDFTYNESIPLDHMIKIIDSDQHIAQVALKRQPWGEAEEVAGGFMNMYPQLWSDESIDDIKWCWQKHFFTTNPSIYRQALTKRGWPEEDHSEQVFTKKVLKDWPEVKFAYYRETSHPPMVHHIGDQRIGNGY